MNILHTETLPKWGGQQNKVLKELKVTKDLGHNVYLICVPDAVIGQRARSMGIPVTEIEMTKRNYHKTIPFFMKFIREHDIDVIFSHGSTDSWIVAVAGNLSRRRPFLVRERHNLFAIKGFLSKLLHTTLFDQIIAISESVKNYLLEVGVPVSKIEFMTSTVDIEHFDRTEESLRSEFKIPDNHTVVGIFADLAPKKGVFDFAEAALRLLKSFPNVTIVFAGSYRPQIKEKIDALFKKENQDFSNRVIWTGYRKDAATIMKGFDIFLYPSHTEGLGTVIIEAMASKLPIVVYDIEPMNRIVNDGINGFTVPYKNVERLADKTAILISNASLRKKMGEASYKKAIEQFSDSTLYNKMHELLEKIS